jgi:hypothetical protein
LILGIRGPSSEVRTKVRCKFYGRNTLFVKLPAEFQCNCGVLLPPSDLADGSPDVDSSPSDKREVGEEVKERRGFS